MPIILIPILIAYEALLIIVHLAVYATLVAAFGVLAENPNLPVDPQTQP